METGLSSRLLLLLLLLLFPRRLNVCEAGPRWRSKSNGSMGSSVGWDPDPSFKREHVEEVTWLLKVGDWIELEMEAWQ